MCSICKRAIKAYRIRIIYYSITTGKPLPTDTNIEAFCRSFFDDNLALVKVEMATKSITRSLKDRRTNFVSQLSSLGE